MKRIISLSLTLFLISSICFAKKKSAVLFKDPYTIEDINKLETSFNSAKKGKSLESLIEISKDKNQILSVRLAALNVLSTSKSPMLKTALSELISQAEFLELEVMAKSIKMLLSFDDLESSEALISALKNSENKIMNLRTSLIEAIGDNNTEDKILALVDLYDISLSNHQRMNELLTLTLGEMEDNRSIPILIDIAQNEEIDLRVRNRAIDILSKKNAPELVDFFIEMLGSPGSNDQMLSFINHSMGLVEKDRLMLALLESYETGKNRYHAVLYSTMDSLEDYNNPNMKPVFLEIAKTDGFPRLLRIKAINALSKFNDPSILDDLISLLEDKNNYDYYYEIMNLAKTLNAEKEYLHKFNIAGYKAMKTNK